jgi:hypothetical protein
MDFYQKYLKYKTKYLNLVNLYGGADPVPDPFIENEPIIDSGTAPDTVQMSPQDIHLRSERAANEVINSRTRNLKLLSEIANFTKKIYINNDKFRTMSQSNRNFKDIFLRFRVIPNFENDNSKYLTKTGFQQDSIIQLYDITSNKYINLIHNNAWDIPKQDFTLPHSELITLRNVTHTPEGQSIEEFRREIQNKNNSVQGVKWYTLLTSLINSGMIQLQPTDKIITSVAKQDIIFPFENNYINIKLNEQRKPMRDINLNILDNTYTIVDHDKQILLSEQLKGGNFIASPPTEHAPNGVLFYIKPITDELRIFLETHLNQPVVELTCSFMFTGLNDIFRHVDEIMTFLPYGINRFKVWFYDITTPSEPSRINPKYDKIQRFIHEVIPQLREEQRNNLNIISNALFGSNYDSNTDNFFIIPIDIGDPPYIFPNPPIFNSVYIETRDQTIMPQLLLSTNGKISQEIANELTQLRSFITDRIVESHIINTYLVDIHRNSTLPGGNLHCVIKQEMEIP